MRLIKTIALIVAIGSAALLVWASPFGHSKKCMWMGNAVNIGGRCPWSMNDDERDDERSASAPISPAALRDR